MRVTTERDKAARLRLVQDAARHTLAADRAASGDRPAEFRALQIFPPFEARDITSGEYAWRQRMPRAWAHAGYLRARIAGTGIKKHRVYQLTSEGRQALARIADDPILASFYIALGHAVNLEKVDDPTEFQPPGLRESEEEEEEEERAEDEEATVDVTREELGADDIAEEERTERAARDDGTAQTLAVFFDRSIAVLERMDDKLGLFEKRIANLEAQVEAQSDLYLDVAGKMSGAATKEDVGAAAANLVEALTKMRGPEDKTSRSLETLSKSVVLQIERINAATSSLDNVSGLVADVEAKVDALAARAVAPSTEMDAGARKELRDAIAAIQKRLNGPFEMRLSDDANWAVVEKAIEKLAHQVADMVEHTARVEKSYVQSLETQRAGLVSATDTMRDLSAAAESVLDGAKYVAGEVIAVALDRAQEDPALRATAVSNMARAMDTYAVARDAVRNRATALGGALIKIQPFSRTGKIDPLVLLPPADDSVAGDK